jgi:hypothetical protein
MSTSQQNHFYLHRVHLDLYQHLQDEQNGRARQRTSRPIAAECGLALRHLEALLKAGRLEVGQIPLRWMHLDLCQHLQDEGNGRAWRRTSRPIAAGFGLAVPNLEAPLKAGQLEVGQIPLIPLHWMKEELVDGDT